ncbi:hypothetical protein SCACP_19410 [Sporomusa carbonis]|uniref:stage III sporulation protein AF n=1 Tax=Sporomusa carbonis TaxID=3076075 RepID=UPI003A72984B
MIDSITAWVKGIIFVVLFASFLELLLPNNSMQRFVKVIMGLFIMLAILNPVISVIENRLMADQIPALANHSVGELSSADILNAANNTAGRREQLARDLYVRDLSKQIRATVLAIDGVADAKVTVNIAEATGQVSKATGKINHVVVYIEPGIIADERKITKVAIGNNTTEAVKESARLPASVIDKVKRTVTELYQLKANQVEVKRIN